MAVTGKSRIGEAGRKVHIARADARASRLAPIVAEIRRGGVTSWYGITMELNKRGVPTATGRGIWEQGRVRRVMERFTRNADAAVSGGVATHRDTQVRPEPDGLVGPPGTCS
jgi:hypothetical protein